VSTITEIQEAIDKLPAKERSLLLPPGSDRRINPGCLKEKKRLYSLRLIKQLPSLMPVAVSPSSEFARWWANGLQNNLRAYCNRATRGHCSVDRRR
jgi:hypothetical protein